MFPLFGVTQEDEATKYSINVEGLWQSSEGSLVVSSISMGPYVPRLVDSVGILVVFLNTQTPKIISPILLHDFLSYTKCLAVGIYICFHQFLDEIFLMTIKVGTNIYVLAKYR